MSDIPTRNREIVRERHRGQCARCGCRGSDIHHRQRRREAGHAVGILVLLCRDCHKWVHGNPNTAKADGYIIEPWETDPLNVPIRTFAGWCKFDNVGGVEYV